MKTIFNLSEVFVEMLRDSKCKLIPLVESLASRTYLVVFMLLIEVMGPKKFQKKPLIPTNLKDLMWSLSADLIFISNSIQIKLLMFSIEVI